MKNKEKRSFDIANLSVSKAPLYALLFLSFAVLAVEALGNFLVSGSQDSLKFAIGHFDSGIYRFSYNGMDHYIMLVVGFIIGIYQFAFLQNKAYARAILVKGEKRENIYNKKVILPVVILTLIVLAIKAVVLKENIMVTGSSSVLYINLLANTLIVIVHGVFGFTAGALGTILSGTIFEAILGGVAIICLPKAILRIADVTASRFLHGYSSFYGTCDETVTFIDPTRQIFETTSDYLNVHNIDSPIPVNSIFHSIFWLVASVVILVLLKRFFCKNYKFEKIGFTNANKLMTTIICFSVATLLGYYIVKLVTYVVFSNYNVIYVFAESALNDTFEWFQMYNNHLFFFAFLIVSIVISISLNLALTRKIKNIKMQIPALCMIVVVFLLSTLVSFTGCFGYTKRLPEIEKVVSVKVNAPFAIAPTETEFLGGSFYSEQELTCINPGIVLTDKDDIAILQKLQLTAIEEKEKETNDGIKIEYQLKDGKTVRRNYFYVSKKTSQQILSLWDTKEVKANYKALLFNDSDENSENFLTYLNYFERFTSREGFTYLTSKDGFKTNITEKMSSVEFNELKKALYKDVTTITSEQWFKPDSTYGMLHFTEEELNADPETVPNLTFFHQMLFPVTSEMTNTVEFLKKHDLFKYLEAKETNYVAYLYDIEASDYWKSNYQHFGITEVEKSELILYNRLPIDMNYPLSHDTLFITEFNRYSGISGDESSYEIPVEKYLNEIVEKGYATKLSEEIAKEYFEKAHFKYYSGVGGKLLLVYYPERYTSQTFILP